MDYIKIKETWGYFSPYDYQTHELSLCCDCYTKHIMKGPLGEFVKVIERY